MKNNSYNKAFTLIELLVVIAIISLLSSIVYASVSGARIKAGTVKTVVQGREIAKGVELARSTLFSRGVSSSAELTNKNTSNSIAQKPAIAKAIFPQLAETPDIDLPVNIPKPSNLITPEGYDDYYYLSDGIVACVDSWPPGQIDWLIDYSDDGCAPVKCGGSDAQQEDFVITYWVDATGYDDPTEAPGYNEDKVVWANPSRGSFFGVPESGWQKYVGSSGWSSPLKYFYLHCT